MPRNAHGHARKTNKRPALTEMQIIRLKRARLDLAEALGKHDRDKDSQRRYAELRQRLYGA